MKKMLVDHIQEMIEIVGCYRADNILCGMLGTKPNYDELIGMIKEVMITERNRENG